MAKSTDGGKTSGDPVLLSTGVYTDEVRAEALSTATTLPPPAGTTSPSTTAPPAGPKGRLDVAWWDTRDDPGVRGNDLYYTYSHDNGETWSKNLRVTDQTVDRTYGVWSNNFDLSSPPGLDQRLRHVVVRRHALHRPGLRRQRGRRRRPPGHLRRQRAVPHQSSGATRRRRPRRSSPVWPGSRWSASYWPS